MMTDLALEHGSLELDPSLWDVQILWQTLDRVRSTLDLTHARLANLLHLTERQYSGLRTHRLPIQPKNIELLAQQIHLTPQRIVTGKIDFKALAAHFQGNATYLPEIYAVGAFSRRRTSIHILEYLDEHYGWRWVDMVLRRFQMTSSIFADPDSAINLNFLRDLCGFLVSSGLPQGELFRMGKHSVVTNFDSELGKKCRRLRNAKELFEASIEELAPIYYDRNCTYRVTRMSDTGCFVESRPNPDAAEAMKTHTPGSADVCAAKAGTFSAITGYLGLPDSDVTHVSCVHRGDATCLDRVTFRLCS